MTSKKLLLPLLCMLCSAFLYSQEPASLGDIARRVRAAKQNGKSATAPATAPSSATAAPVNAQDTPSPSAKPADVRSTAASDPTADLLHLPPGIPAEGTLNFLDGIQEELRQLFDQEKFETIDMIADQNRSARKRFPGGFWAIHNIYLALSAPRRGSNAGEAEWQLHLERLKRWIAQRPNSITARVALAEAYQSYGWKARGSGPAASVTEDGWRLLHERLELSGKVLADAFTLPVKCPEWYLAMQTLVQKLDSSKEIQAAAFAKAVAFDPDYHYYYRIRAISLEEKWGGEEGEMAAFAEKASDRVGGKKGDIIYYQIAYVINCNCGEDDNLHGLSWPRVKRGYLALEEMYGVALLNLNKIGYMAAVGGDPLYANEIFARIGEDWDQNTWKSRSYFETARNWAKAGAAAKIIEDALNRADENVKTAEGRKFDGEIGKTFAANYSTVVSDCLKRSGETVLFPFDLALRLGKDGSVEQIYSSVTSRVSLCVKPEVQKGRFPVPPRESYWVKISLQPSAEDVIKFRKAMQQAQQQPR